ncbi:MAG TPA: hypothetical protein VND97_06645 [Beijerinckiaceae bacterium]|nr:hypothetical protein [Beijerinckiaceae bacterium]
MLSVSSRGAILRRKMAVLTAAVLGLVFPLLCAPAQAAPDANATRSANATPSAKVVLIGRMIAGFYQGKGGNASTAIFVMHETANFIGAPPCVQLAKRGFTALCAKSQFDADGQVNWDQLALDVGQGVSYLRSAPGVRHVILVGWSGGAPIMAYYQNVAENGLAACQAPARLDPCSKRLAKLPPADGVVLLDGIPGLAFTNMSALDPSLDRPDGLTSHRNPSLYLFNAKNGWNSSQMQSSAYSRPFADRYTRAEAAREAKLVSMAERLKKRIAAGKGAFTDNAPFPVGHDGARIWSQDTKLLSHTKGAYPLITPKNPSGKVQTIYSVRVPAAAGIHNSTPRGNDSWGAGQGAYSVKSFLSISAIKAPDYRLTEDSIEGVDWASTNTATVSNVAGISAPLLIMSMTGHYWLVPSEMYYQAAKKSRSKTLAFVYGALHTFTPCKVCSTPLGPFGDTVGETFDYVANWLNTHFPNRPRGG